MLNHRRISWLVFALMFVGIGSRCRASAPHATFAVKDGFVEVTLRQDGKPVANATIEITKQNGMKFGESVVDDGLASFFLPPGDSFVVEIKAGDRTADPIRLFKVESSVEPARVLLSYGLRPCCRSIKPANNEKMVGTEIEVPSTTMAESMPWPILVPGVASVLAAAAFWSLFRRR